MFNNSGKQEETEVTILSQYNLSFFTVYKKTFTINGECDLL